MIVHLTQLAKLVLERRSTAVFSLVITAMLWAGIGLKHLGDIREDRLAAERTHQNFAMVFEENVLRSIGEIDKALLYLRRTIATRKDTTDFHTIVSSTDVLSEIIVQVAIIDASGMMRASNAISHGVQQIDLSDREHYRVHVNNSEDTLFISKPVVGRASGKWSVQFTRRFLNRDGTFAGVVVASLNPDHFTNFYNMIDLGSSAAISLIGSDGVVRSSGGSAADFVLGQEVVRTELYRRIKEGANATFEHTKQDGEARLVTIRKVRGYPLWVTVSTRTADIFADSGATFQLNSIAGVLLTLATLAAMKRILRSEERARQKTTLLQLTLEHMSQGIMLVTKDLQIPIINQRCVELLDLPSEFVKKPPRFDELIELETQRGRNGALCEALSAARCDEHDSPRRIAVYERAAPNGRVVDIRSGHLPDGSLVQTFTDVTERCRAEAEVKRLASEDPLTGLPNRRIFQATLEQLIRLGGSGQDNNEITEFAILFLDIDRFKVINDTLGHRIGDLLLKEVAQRLRSVLTSTDLLARLGGDEFAIIVPKNVSGPELEALASKLVQTIVQPYELDRYQVRSSVSIGIAVGPRDGTNADDLLMAADLALYAVKAATRGTYRFYENSLNTDLNERRQIEEDLREAIERNELDVYFQPIINLKSNAIVGFESLARWYHPTKGMVPPSLFIPVAEDSGLILALGEWVLREACCQAVSWPGELNVAVNLSPVQFSAPNLFETIRETLVHTGLAPHRLELEITERIFMENNDRTLSTLRRLKQLGVRISLDDFGTGYSSLSYLSSFPFDKIKIDRSFVSELDRSDRAVIIQAVLSIARALGMPTTAEGVELIDQQQFLAALGCDEAQGFLFSAPVPVHKISATLADWAAKRALAA